jgi:signal transduction histidine kinase
MATVMRERARSAEQRLHGLLALQSMLARVSRELGPALELQPVLATVLSAMRSLVDFRGGTICLVDDRGVYVAAADPDVVSDDVLAARIPVGQGLAGRVVVSGRPVYSPDVVADDRVDPAIRQLGSNAGMRSYLAVPLVCLGQVIGLVQVDSTEADAFDTDDLHVLEGLAAQVAGAVESARRHEHIMELERLKGDFVARVSHELRTPLTIIGGFVTTLQAHGDNLTEQQRLWLDRIVAADDRLGRLIDELLTVTSLEAGMTEPQPADVALVEVLERVRADALHPESVTVACPAGLRLLVDGKILGHALGLLVDNALKYAGDAELLAGEDDDGRPWVAVLDHGPGVAPHLRDHVFERFVRGDDSRPGMGLGLPVVRNLATAIGARVDLADAPGGGASFTLRFD